MIFDSSSSDDTSPQDDQTLENTSVLSNQSATVSTEEEPGTSNSRLDGEDSEVARWGVLIDMLKGYKVDA